MLAKNKKLPEELETIRKYALYALGKEEGVEGLLKHPVMLIIKGNELYKKGNYTEALSYYKSALSQNKELIEAKVNIGFAYVRLGNYDEARKIFESLPQEYISEYVLNNLGNIYARMGNLEKSIEMYKKAIEKNPNFSLPFINLGNIYIEKGEYDSARKYLEKALQTAENEDRKYMAMKLLAYVEYFSKNYDSCVKYVDDILKHDENQADLWLLKAECAGKTKKIHEAEKYARKAYDLSKSVESLVALATIKLEKGDLDNAIKFCNQSLKKDSSYSKTYVTLAKAYYLKGDYEKALRAAILGLKYKDRISLRIIKAECLRKLKRYDEALQEINKIIEKKKDYSKAYIIRSHIYMDTNRLKEAEDDLNTARSIEENFELYTSYAKLYELMNDKLKCVSALKNALNFKEDIEILKKLCNLLYELGEYNELSKYLDILNEKLSEYSYGWYMKGEIAFKNGNLEEAEKYYSLAVEIDKNFVDAYLKLAIIAIKKGEEEKAKEYMEKVVSLSPERRDVWEDLLKILMEFGYYEDVIEYVPKAVQHTNDEALRLYEVKALISLGRFEDALSKIEELENKMPDNRESLLYKGIVLYHLGQYTKSLEILEELREEFEVDANYYIAKIYLDTGRAAECLEIADKYDHIEKFIFLKLDAMLRIKAYDELMEYLNQKMKELSGKALTDAMFFMVRFFLETGKVDDALVVAEKILERDPNHYDTLVTLSEIYYSEGNYEKAAEYAERALNIKESEEIMAIYAKSMYYLGNYEKSLEYANKLLSINETHEYLLIKGNCLFSLGKYEDAMEIAKNVISKDSKNANAHLLAGKVSYTLGKYEDAIEHLTETLMYTPENWEAYYYRGLSYIKTENFLAAASDLDYALISCPDLYQKDVLEKLAEAEIKRGNYEKIRKLAEDYGILSDKFRIALGEAYYHMGEYEKCIETLKEVKEENLLGEKQYYMALAYIALNKLEDAERCIREAEKLGKADAQTLYYHATILFKLNRYQEAYESFLKYLERGGEETPEVSFNMGICLYNQGKYEESIKYFEKAEVEYEESFLYEGIAYAKISKYEDAINLFEIADKKGVMDAEGWYNYALSLEKIGKDPIKAYENCWKFGLRNEEIAYKLVKLYMDKGMKEEALKYADIAVNYGDEGRKLVALLYYNLEKYEEGLKLLENLSDENSRILKAKILWKLNKWEEAVNILKEMSEIPEASYVLVKILVENERYEEALKYIEKGKEFGNLDYEEMLCFIKTEKYEEAEKKAKELLSKGIEIPTSTEILGISLFHQNKYEESIEYLEKAREMGRKVEKYLGEAYFKIGKYDKAVEILKDHEDKNAIKITALSYYNMGKYKNALNLFEKVIDDAEMRYYAGISAYKISDYKKAIEYLEGLEKGKEELAESYFHVGKYDKVVELNPKNKVILGISLYNLGKYNEAYEILKESVSEAKNKAEIYYYLALSSLQINKNDEAKEYIESARRYGYEGDLSVYEGIISFKTGDYEKAAKLLENSKERELRKYYGISLYYLGKYRDAVKILKTQSDNEARKYYALSLMHMKKYDIAAKIFKDVGDKINAAKCFTLMGNYDEALDILKEDVSDEAKKIKFECLIRKGLYHQALNIYDSLPPTYKKDVAKDVCDAYLSLKMYDEAEKICDKYFDNEDFDWWYLRAKVDIALGRYSDAINDLNNAKRIDPKNPHISKLMAGILLNMGDYKNALKEAKKAVEALSEDAVAWYNLGLAYYRNDNVDEAKVALSESVRLDENLSEGWELLSTIYLKEGEFEEAYNTLKKALQIEKKHRTLVNMGIACYELEKYDESLQYLNEALKYKEDYLTLYYKALVLIELDRKNEAIQLLRKIIKMKPDFIEARKILGDLLGGE